MLKNKSIILEQPAEPTMTLEVWHDYLFKKIDLLNKRRQYSGITYWALLTAIFVLFIRLSTLINSKPSFDYIVIILFFFSFIGIFNFGNTLLNKISQSANSFATLHVLKDMEKKGVALVCFLRLILVASELVFITYISFYSSTTFPLGRFLVILISIELFLYIFFFVLVLSPFPLVYSQTQPTKTGMYLELISFILLLTAPICFGYFAVSRIAISGNLEWFYLEVPLLFSCLWVLVIYFIKYRFEKIPIQELEDLLDQMMTGKIVKSEDVRDKFSLISDGIDYKKWMIEHINAAKKIISTFSRKTNELQQLIEDLPDECKTCDHAAAEHICAHKRRMTKYREIANDLIASINDALHYMRSLLFLPLFYVSPKYIEESDCFFAWKDNVKIILYLKQIRKKLQIQIKRQENIYKAKLKQLKAVKSSKEKSEKT